MRCEEALHLAPSSWPNTSTSYLSSSRSSLHPTSEHRPTTAVKSLTVPPRRIARRSSVWTSSAKASSAMTNMPPTSSPTIPSQAIACEPTSATAPRPAFPLSYVSVSTTSTTGEPHATRPPWPIRISPTGGAMVTTIHACASSPTSRRRYSQQQAGLPPGASAGRSEAPTHRAALQS